MGPPPRSPLHPRPDRAGRGPVRAGRRRRGADARRRRVLPHSHGPGPRSRPARHGGPFLMELETAVDEIADGIYRLSTNPGFPFNQYLVVAAEPLLFHTGPRPPLP